MNLEKVVFGFFVIFACTLNFGFFIGDIERPELHHPMELFAAVVVNLDIEPVEPPESVPWVDSIHPAPDTTPR